MSILKNSVSEDDAYPTPFLGADLELDGSRRREISLYRHNELVLTVEHGVTLGFLKLCYSSDPKFTGILQGVQSRSTSNQSPVTSVLLSDERVLDQDEYELIVIDQSTDHSAMLQQNISSTLPPSPASISLSNPSLSNTSTSQISLTVSSSSSTTEKKTGNFVCEYCHLPFVSKAKFLRHRRIHTEEKPYECVHCHESFSHHVELRNHRNEHHMTNKSFKCSFCPKTFAARAELKGHLWRHTGEKNEKCRICGKGFATKGNLKLHLDKHIGVHKHKCPFCPQHFTSHSSLEAHMAKHTGMKAYKCRHCPKSYAQAGQLTSHERVHTGEKPFVCEVCNKGFRLNSTRLAHEKRHSGARPHICDTCGRSFSMPDQLRRHLKTHEDKLDRLVPCPFCKKKIFSGRNMRKHLMRHRDLNLTDSQAKAISTSLKPDRDSNERDVLDEDQRSNASTRNARQLIRCIECGEEVKSVRKLFEHLSTAHFNRELTAIERKEMRLRHGLQKLHHCPCCSAYFLDYRLLRSHVLGEHAGRAEEIGFTNKNNETSQANASYKCPNCSMCFHLRGALDQHIFKEHLTTVIESTKDETVAQFRCWYCRLNFASPEEVVNHMTTQHATLDVLSKRVEMTGENDVTSSGLWTCPHCPVNSKSHEEYLSHLELHVADDEGSTIKLPSKLSSTDETSKYLNPMRIDTGTSDSMVDKFLTTSVKALHEIYQQSMSTQTPAPLPPSVTSTSLVEDEVYLTTSSLSATSADLSMASSDLTQVDFVPLTSSETGDEDLECTDGDKDNDNITSPIPTVPVTVGNTDANIGIAVDVSSEHPTPLLEVKNKKKLKPKDTTSVKKTTKQTSTSTSTATSATATSIGDSAKVRVDLPVDIAATTQKEDAGVVLTTDATSTIPFRCWFCSHTFNCPEEVVAHMTNEHDNLDNLSRRIELTDVAKPSTISTHNSSNSRDKNIAKLKHLKRSADASLSPVEGHACPKCPKKLGSKEAYELHMMVHTALNNMENPNNISLLSRQRSIDRTQYANNLEDVSLPVEPISIEESASTAFNINYSTAASKPSPKPLVETTQPVVLHHDKKTTRRKHKAISKKSKEKKQQFNITSSKTITTKIGGKSSTTVSVDGSNNVNMCIHCSRVFCGRKALYVHTLKMHGKEYLQKRTPRVKPSPFTCWFCSANFNSPELVVEHMTNSHENLDKLSKRIEAQELPMSVDPPQKVQQTTPVHKFIPIAPHKQMLPATTTLRGANAMQPANQHPSDSHQQAPPGFKVSYALAYVPVFVPEDRPDDDEIDQDDEPGKN